MAVVIGMSLDPVEEWGAYAVPRVDVAYGFVFTVFVFVSLKAVVLSVICQFDPVHSDKHVTNLENYPTNSKNMKDYRQNEKMKEPIVYKSIAQNNH